MSDRKSFKRKEAEEANLSSPSPSSSSSSSPLTSTNRLKRLAADAGAAQRVAGGSSQRQKPIFTIDRMKGNSSSSSSSSPTGDENDAGDMEVDDGDEGDAESSSFDTSADTVVPFIQSLANHFESKHAEESSVEDISSRCDIEYYGDVIVSKVMELCKQYYIRGTTEKSANENQADNNDFVMMGMDNDECASSNVVVSEIPHDLLAPLIQQHKEINKELDRIAERMYPILKRQRVREEEQRVRDAEPDMYEGVDEPIVTEYSSASNVDLGTLYTMGTQK